MAKTPITWIRGKSKIEHSLEHLLTHRGSKTDAISEIYLEHLMHLNPIDVPQKVWEELQELGADLRKHEDRREGRVKASARKMHHTVATKHLSRMAFWMGEFLPS